MVRGCRPTFTMTSVITTVLFSTATPLCADELDLSGQLTAQAIAVQSEQAWLTPLSLTYMPQLAITDASTEAFSVDAYASARIHLQQSPNQANSYAQSADWYRLNVQFKTDHTDVVFGLQTLNFGPAVILRSLQWFDQVNPTDPTQSTLGVNALRVRHFLENGGILWLWTMAGNVASKGQEVVATSENTIEGGGRVQWPLANGELGVTSHLRKTPAMGFTGTVAEDDLLESRIALDGRWDIGVGLWFESVLIDQGSNAANNYRHQTTLGSDYTFGFGNGLYVVAEHQITQFSNHVLDWDSPDQTSVLHIRYPLNLLDSLSALSTVQWTDDIRTAHHVNWQRVYDNWIVQFSGFNRSNPNTYGVQGTVVFNH